MRKNNFLTRIIAAVLTAVILAAVPQITSQASPKKMSDGGIFDAEYYAEQNPDVVAAVGTSEAALYNHYETVGKSEGRLPYASASASDTSKHSAKEQAVYNAMMAMQSKFPEGMTWTNANGYAWKGGIIRSVTDAQGLHLLSAMQHSAMQRQQRCITPIRSVSVILSAWTTIRIWSLFFRPMQMVL